MGYLPQFLIIVILLFSAAYKQNQLKSSINELEMANSKLSCLSEMAIDPSRHKELILVLKNNFYVVKEGIVVEHDKDWR